MICKVCGQDFQPIKGNQRYCGVLCRKKIEVWRKQWDLWYAYVKRGELAANNPENPPHRRQEWARWAVQRRLEIGERP